MTLTVDRTLIEAARELGPSGKILRERALTQATLGQAEALLRSARSYFYETIAAAWERTLVCQPSTLEHKADLMLAGAYAASSAAKVADLMHGLAGTSGIYAKSRLERPKGTGRPCPRSICARAPEPHLAVDLSALLSSWAIHENLQDDCFHSKAGGERNEQSAECYRFRLHYFVAAGDMGDWRLSSDCPAERNYG